ncbi:MAG: hypothetical protein NC402_01485 [Prevotella sp.]|nr:hypothetical protein [Prevotella sp.]MCM1074537.1 hypothetical protein [Ruminococcus sp.]
MKLLAYILTFILCSLGCSAFAATPEQMEQGRAIAIKYCLRDLNNYSDYLDKLNPKTVSELEKKLKDTEKENIKKLKNIQLPDEKDYSAWDKAQFKKYWAGSFTAKANLKSKGFTESKIVASLDKMTVTKKEAPKPDDVKQEEQKPADAKTDEATPTENSSSQTEQDGQTEGNQVAEAQEDEQIAEAPAQVPTEEVKPTKAEPQQEKSDNTTSIIILCVLVVVVVILVVYALNVMKKNRMRQNASAYGRNSYRDQEDDDDEEEKEYRPRRAHRSNDGDTTRYAPRRSAPAATVISDPEEESPFAAYSNFEPEPQPAPVQDARDREIARLKAEIAALQGQVNRQAARPITETPHRSQPRVIYLAQANADGVFTRADARYNVGNSIFKLVTTNGVSGSFSVIEDPTVYEIALMMPRDFLSHACAGPDLLNSATAKTIVNEASGTAIFEDGRWRVSRKAQIRYTR